MSSSGEEEDEEDASSVLTGESLDSPTQAIMPGVASRFLSLPLASPPPRSPAAGALVPVPTATTTTTATPTSSTTTSSAPTATTTATDPPPALEPAPLAVTQVPAPLPLPPPILLRHHPQQSVFTNAVCQSIYKVNGALVGPVVRYVLLHGSRFDLFSFCAMRNGARPITCIFPTADACSVFERDVEHFLRTVSRGSGSNCYVLALPLARGGVGQVNLRSYIHSAPLMTTHDLVNITREGIGLRSGYKTMGRLTMKPTIFGFLQQQMVRGEFTFVSPSTAASFSMNVAHAWQDLMLDNVVNSHRCWTLRDVSRMTYGWVCGICHERAAGLSFDQPASEAAFVAQLPCGHGYHLGCMARVPAAAGGRFACPSCRCAYGLATL
jgi:hypothetical protein